jgi:hypothetical protein
MRLAVKVFEGNFRGQRFESISMKSGENPYSTGFGSLVLKSEINSERRRIKMGRGAFGSIFPVAMSPSTTLYSLQAR